MKTENYKRTQNKLQFKSEAGNPKYEAAGFQRSAVSIELRAIKANTKENSSLVITC